MEPFTHPIDNPANLEFETRKIINAFIRRQHIALPKWCWLYLDWYEDQGYDVKTWIRDIDLERAEYPLPEAIQYAVWYCDCQAYKTGGNRPEGLLPPQGWEFADEAYDQIIDTPDAPDAA